ncbi:MAG: hypothetical protein LBP72_11030 [Dysgonamonadaceae bacterium]|jgi:hypothetical protein|nr:hypothetical protein [Dysgonamonadaceae bacterium]
MMKKIFFSLLLTGSIVMMSACFGGAGVKGKVDPKVLENKEEVQKIYDAVLKSMGEQATKANEITIDISNPADKGKTGDTYLYLTIDVQDSKKPKQLIRQMFHGELGAWQSQEVTVDVRGSDEEKANYSLESELFDFKAKVSGEKLHKIILDAYEKENKEPEKYIYRYVNNVRITVAGYSISVEGKLASNDQMLNAVYYYDLEGNFIGD